MNNPITNSVPAIQVRQWLPQWDQIHFNPDQNQSRPKEHFYMLSLPASTLRKLAGISRRSTDSGLPRKDDLGIQRRHDPDRSEEIRRYVEGGYPWSSLSEPKRRLEENNKLRKPGWLPTAVVVNILNAGDERNGDVIRAEHTIRVEDHLESNAATLYLPSDGYAQEQVRPIEVIDGQHRLFAFDDNDEEIEDYHLPVVAFHGLDISWQAYLFWTINIKPKKINASLAFDLYPLLREQDWLDSGEIVSIYRESRAQELTEMLWSSPQSPWHKRINMLGGTRKDNGPVTQAAFIRSLMASMVKPWRSHRGVGGIFGGTPDGKEGLSWSRLQQSAFLLAAWRLLASEVMRSDAPWAEALRADSGELGAELTFGEFDSPAFAGANSLLATDQGVRGFQSIINDLCYIRHRELDLESWGEESELGEVTPTNVERVAETLTSEPVYRFLGRVCASLATFDWRTSGAPGLEDGQRLAKAALRGSGGYKELRGQLAQHLKSSPFNDVASAAEHLGG